MKFGKFIALQLRFAFSSSLAIGLVIGMSVLLSGGAEGDISLDIDISSTDSIWFLLGIPLITTLLFLIFSPLSFFIHAAVSRVWPPKSGHDV